MPYRRMSSLFTAAASAATAAVTRLSATPATSATTAVNRLSATAAVSVVSAATALALAAPAASAAPIPLPHVRSGDGITGVGHHAPAAQPSPAGHHASAAQPAPAGHHAPAAQPSPASHHAPATQPGHAAHRPPTGQDTPAPDLSSVDHLTLTVRGTGSAATDGTFELYCHPARGNHPNAKKACKKLDGMTRWGRDPFAPVPQGVNCTMIYGGPATAHVTGTWAGRPVNADFRRTNGCEISRWSTFEPLLPSTSS
ncbi:SSI family serine proteinase inhibitor [Streptomyces sp. C10]|uniref:SSI family serine proteinase inhibitor n=1 Tax=Streptomyces sp. C10 TaxID=531941 RepID=UPI0039819242